jgi:hypothetical protein
MENRRPGSARQDAHIGCDIGVNGEPTKPAPLTRQSWRWLAVQLGLGLGWAALLASRARRPEMVAVMLLLAGWLPSVALACWQVQHRRWRALILSDLLAAGLLVLLACSAYLPLFFFNVIWFVPLAVLPRGVLAEMVVRLVKRRPDLTA